MNSYREEEGGEKSLLSLFTRGLVKDGSSMLTSPLFYRRGRIRFILFFSEPIKMLPRPPRKTRKGARSEARGRRPNAPFLVFLGGPGVASLIQCA